MDRWDDGQVEASPMKMLIERISPCFEIVIFPEKMILNDPIETWPIVDVVMAWHSDGRSGCFP